MSWHTFREHPHEGGPASEQSAAAAAFFIAHAAESMTCRQPVCALVVGHRASSQGAVSVGGVSEWDFNKDLARDIAAATFGARVRIVHRDDDAGGYNRLPAQLNALEPDFIVSMHFNAAASAEATGSEVLHWPGSEGGEELAALLLGEFVEALQLPSRGTKPRGSGRGSTLLGGTRAPCVIAEPFFGSNAGDWQTAVERKDLLAMSYKRSIEQHAAKIRAAEGAQA